MARFFAASPPGLEALLARELGELGLTAPRRYVKAGGPEGGIAFEGGREALYRANLELRCAERVLVELARFKAHSFADLETSASRVAWDQVLPRAGALAVRADCRRSKLYHERAVAERLARVAGRRLAAAADAPAARLHAELVDDVCTLFLDSSGKPLHRRGYRLQTAKAPLRETLAAALLLASGWDAASPLLDPFCGSGTIAVEAALMARRMAPGRARRFAFETWPDFDAPLWQRVRAQARAKERPAPAAIAASDRDAGAIEAARANAGRAGVAESIAFSCRAVSAAEPPPGAGFLVTNPPYGARVRGGADARDVYAQLGKLLRGACAGWRATLLCPGVDLARATGLRAAAGFSTKNGGLDVRIVSLA